MLEVDRITDGLWRWRCDHPEWDPSPSPTGGWSRLVESTYAEVDSATVLIDPQLPETGSADRSRFDAALARDRHRLGGGLSVLITNPFHRRSTAELGGVAATLPSGVERLDLDDPNRESWYFIPVHRALIVGDLLIGRGGLEADATDPLQFCPAGWYHETSASRAWFAHDRLHIVERALELDIAHVLPAHGAAVVDVGRDALSRLVPAA